MALAKFEEKHAFVLSARDAERLWDLIEKNFGPSKAEASCSDSIHRTFTTLNELVGYENPRARAINSLTLSARDDERTRYVSVTLGARYSSSIDVSIYGPEEVVVSAKNDFGEVFDGVKPWYSPIARIDFFYIAAAVVFFAMSVLQIVTGSESDQSQSPGIGFAVMLTAFVIVLFLGLVLFVWGLNKLRARFFPVAAFAIGQGLGRYELEEKFRWGVIIGVIVSIVASLIVATLLS